MATIARIAKANTVFIASTMLPKRTWQRKSGSFLLRGYEMTKTMNKLKVLIPSSNPRKYAGQGMVEFALALPILLLVVYGLLETGRLLFIYSSTVTAARQAVRYGSTIGTNDSGIPFYRDCSGINDAANRVGFINSFNDINITYDRGPGGTNGVAIPGVNPDPTVDTCSSMNDNTLQNGDRIKVQVSAEWAPIISVSRLIPSFQSFTITSAAERTILTSVEINVPLDSSGGTWGGQTGTLTLNVTKSSNTYSQAGEVITYTYTLTNSSNLYSTNGPFSITDNRVSVNCSGAANSLAPGTSTTCTGTLTITQTDLDAGTIFHSAVANGSGVTSNPVDVTLTASQLASLTLEKTVDPTIASVAGSTVTYTYKLINSGNVTLQSPYTVTDNRIPSNQINCSGASSTIAPGAFIQCTASYVITAADVSAGSVTNTATATAVFNSTQVTSNTATAKVETSLLTLSVFASPINVSTLNQKITYSYILKNNSNSTTISGPYAIVDNRSPVNLSCPNSSIAPGGTITCTGDYFVTQADLDAGSITNQAYATASGGTMTSGLKSSTVTVTQNAAISLSINPPSPLPVIVAGTVINYNYVITNTGNITLSSPFLVNEFNLGVIPSCPSTPTLAPSGTITCTLAYTVKASDVSKNIITSVAIAYAKAGTQEIASTQVSKTIVIANGARLGLSIKSAPVNFQSANTPLAITFTLQNTGSVTLSAPYSVSANAFLGAITCSNSPATLASGDETTCTASYNTTDSDLNAGGVTITATATAKNGASNLSSSSVNLSIPSIFQCFVYHRLLTTPAPSITFPRTNQLQMNVINDSATAATINLQSITLKNWGNSSPGGQSITSISFGGIQIYAGNASNATFTTSAPFSNPATLAPGQTKALIFTFSKNYKDTGNEVVEISFVQSSCPKLVSSDNTQVK